MSMTPVAPLPVDAPLRCLNAMRPLGMADLIRMRAAGLELEAAATMLGYEFIGSDQAPKSSQRDRGSAEKSPIPSSEAAQEQRDEGSVGEGSEQPAVPPLWRMIGPRVRPYDENQVLATPSWAQGLRACTTDELATQWHLRPRPAPLVPLPRLGPLLRKLLRVPTEFHAIDSARYVQELANCRTPKRVPRIVRPSWTPRLQLYWDQSQRLGSFWHDQHDVLHWLRAWRGTQGLELIIMDDDGHPNWQVPLGRGRQTPVLSRPPMPPDAGTTVLILSDLGYGGDSKVRLQWLRMAQKAQKRGTKPSALCPLTPSHCHPTLQRAIRIHEWERTTPQLGAALQPSPADELSHRWLDRLFVYLSPSVCVDWALLRAVRRQMPRGVARASLEIDAYLDPRATAQCEDGFVIEYEAAKLLRQELQEADRALVAPVFERVHRYFGLAMRCEEQLIWGDADQRKAAEQDLARYVQRLREKGNPTETERGYSQRNERRQAPSGWRSKPLAAYWAVHHAKGGGFDTALPEGLDVRDVLWILEDLPSPIACHVWQRGERLLLASSESQQQGLEEPLWDKPGCYVGQLLLRLRELDVEQRSPLGASQRGRVPLNQPAEKPLPRVAAGQRLVLESDLSTAELVLEPKPPWASAFYRDESGLWIGFDEPVSKQVQLAQYPTWARRLDRDDYGLYADLELAPTLVTRLRWIPPGKFLMGSPEDELGRWDGEGPQHEVTLTQGLWLAESPCTQAEWQAVMGSNPSRFKGDGRCPVEQVSWEDCQQFCQKLKERLPELDARLPTEAEWEYACRAGTGSAYNDGSDCTEPEGPDPALMGLGWFVENSEGKTHPVKQLKPNAWGIYDAHGNVREWCEDWYGEYSAAVQQDPRGPEEGSYRVVRGGGWSGRARGCRSAFRDWRLPVYRLHNQGFRLAAGQESIEEKGRSETSGRVRSDEGRGAQAPDGEWSARQVGQSSEHAASRQRKR